VRLLPDAVIERDAFGGADLIAVKAAFRVRALLRGRRSADSHVAVQTEGNSSGCSAQIELPARNLPHFRLFLAFLGQYRKYKSYNLCKNAYEEDSELRD
jgi:hypothetical protein